MPETATPAPGVEQQITDLVRSGAASCRRDIVDQLRIAPATAASAIKKLLHEGVLVDAGPGPSTGGRRPQLLRLKDQRGVTGCAELGAHHARFGLVDASGHVIASDELALDISEGPEAVFASLSQSWQGQAEASQRDLAAVAVAFPGPVDVERGLVVSPARMPGWSGVPTHQALVEAFGLPAVIENDARAAALGEAVRRRDVMTEFIYVKAGTGIGGAWVTGGDLYRGTGGLAGEITHNQVAGVSMVQGCGCGKRGCLELVASGAALSLQLRDQGLTVNRMSDLVDLAREARPEVSTVVRSAGAHLGEVLAPLVNFLNPAGVLIGGGLSTSDAFVASVRGVLYDRCLPMCTQGLVIEATQTGQDGALLGLGELARRVLTRSHL